MKKYGMATAMKRLNEQYDIDKMHNKAQQAVTQQTIRAMQNVTLCYLDIMQPLYLKYIEVKG